MEYRIVEKKGEKEALKENFLSFFSFAYRKKPDDAFWEHQVVGAPYEDSPLFLALDGENIVGSSLMILQKCSIESKEYLYYLFTTSAILTEYRANGVYAELLRLQKEYARKKRVDFIFAFPNSSAYPALKFFGGFKKLQVYSFAESLFGDLKLECSENSLIVDSRMFKWRFEHKDYKFYNKGGVIIVYKKYNDSYDILGIYKQEDFQFSYTNSVIGKNERIVTITPYLKSGLGVKIEEKLNCTYYPINENIDYTKMKINLLMSDVF